MERIKEGERKERWKQGRKDDMQEGKKRKVGNKERRKDVRMDGWNAGRKDT